MQAEGGREGVGKEYAQAIRHAVFAAGVTWADM